MEEGLERSVCVFVRAIANERVRADKCFGAISPSPPPPPPKGQGPLALLKAALLQRQVRRGGSSGPTKTVPLTDEEQYAKEAEEAEAAQMAYLDELAADNPQMRSVLSEISATVHAGRRLWERSADARSHDLIDNVLQTAAFGTSPITGITVAQCETLCAAIENGTVGVCKGIAFARASASARDLTLRQCILLRDLGGCTPGSFAGAVFARRDTNVKRLPTHSNLASKSKRTVEQQTVIAAPFPCVQGCMKPTAYDNPLCVQMAQGR